MTNRLFLFAFLLSLLAAGNPRACAAEKGANRSVLFFGDSLTAGYGVAPEQAYPEIIQEKIEQAGLPFRVVNAGLSGETTAGGLRRVDWVLRRPVAVFVLALSGNDGLRGIPPTDTEKNLRAIIERVKKSQPDTVIVLAGMEAPPNMGPVFTSQFRAIFPRIAAREKVALIPFLLAGVGGIDSLNQADGIHPNPQGHRIVAAVVWKTLKPILEGLAAGGAAGITGPAAAPDAAAP